MVEAPSPPVSSRRPGAVWNWKFHGAWITPALSLVACLALWEAVVRYAHVPVYLVPAPSLIATKLVAAYPLFLQETLHSVVSIIVGFALAVLIGIPAATLMIYSEWFRRGVYPILLTAQVLPESLMLIRSMGGTRWQSFWKIRLPSALASIFGGFKVAITFAVVGTIVAEFVGSDHGLGYILVLARGNLDTVTVFAAILWLIAIGFLFYFAVEVAERFFVKGRAANRKHELGAGL